MNLPAPTATSLPTVTMDMFTIGSMYFLQDCRPIAKELDAYQRALIQRGYNLLIDPATNLALIAHHSIGLEPLSVYRFGAIATKDSRLTKELIQQAQGGRLEELAKGDAKQLCTEMLGTVIMELDTMSARLWDYTSGPNKKGNEGEMGSLLIAAMHPDGRYDLMGQVPEGQNFIFGVKAVYHPGVRGYLEGTNLHLFPIEGGQRYSKDYLKKAVPGSHPRSVLGSRKGVPRDFPDMRIVIRRKTAEGAHDAVDGMVKSIHGVDGVIYMPLLVERDLTKNPTAQEMMMHAIGELVIGDEARLAEAEQVRNSGERHLLQDLLPNLIKQ